MKLQNALHIRFRRLVTYQLTTTRSWKLLCQLSKEKNTVREKSLQVGMAYVDILNSFQLHRKSPNIDSLERLVNTFLCIRIKPISVRVAIDAYLGIASQAKQVIPTAALPSRFGAARQRANCVWISWTAFQHAVGPRMRRRAYGTPFRRPVFTQPTGA